jgi:hypothetical protein
VATPKYVDSLSTLKDTSAASVPLDVPVTAGSSIALVLGANIELVLKQGDDRKGLYTMFGMGQSAAAKEDNPQYLVTNAISTLRLKYPRIEPVDDLAAAAQRKFSTTIVVDFRAVFGQMSGQTTSATITVIFLDENQKPISRFETSGSGVIPYPATTTRFREAADTALAEFREKAIRLMH